MFVHVPAMRGKIGSRTYYACLLPMNSIPNLFKFTNWIDFSPEDREQRVLNVNRVPDITEYIVEHEDDYLFASITASYKSEPKFEPANGTDADGSIGVLKLKLGDELIINDGQHRCAAIVEALKKSPKIHDHTISVLLFPWESKQRVQQMFSDLNRYVQKTSKSLDVLYDKRDPFSIATMFALEKIPVFKELTEMADASLKSKSTKIFTLAAIYDANRDLLRGREDVCAEDNAKHLIEYWSAVAKNMQDWTKVFTGHKTSVELRAESLSAHSTVLRALGGLGVDLMKSPDWKDRLAGLKAIDWLKKNPEWQNVCIIANSVVSNRQARSATKAYIKQKLGMELSDGELKSINQPLKSAA